MKKALGIDIGGTGIKIGIISALGNIIESTVIPHRVPSDPGRVVDDIARAVSLLEHTGNKNLKKTIRSAGVGVAGDIDQGRGVVRFSGNFGWKNVRLGEMLKAKLKLPVVVDNDANAASWGSYCIEFDRKVNNLICFTLGTGIGGGLILEKKLYRGSTGTAGELGHVTLYPGGIKCACGNRGCIERYVGAYDISAEVNKRIKAGQKTMIWKLAGGDPGMITPKLIHKAAQMGDRFAINTWKKAGENLGIVIASMINVLNPDIIVLAGGIAGAGEYIMKPIRETVRERSFESARGRVKITVSRLGSNLGLIGAGCLVLFN